MVEDFVSVSLRDGLSGVYLLLREGRVVYVGQSVNLFSRVAVHWRVKLGARRGLPMKDRWQPPAIDFDEVRFKRCAKDALDKEEFALIQRYLPQHNVRLNRAVSPIEAKIAELPCVKELIAKAAQRKAASEIKRGRVV